ncbi:uncharacterized protein LOC122529361 [Frieseomelitta varia]|uniref:uncharacterized protein LOC122529361 n=1 Tax=Frieseomelitta varia TaxID=561572 RepID=UPI001CB682C0|nr:uncharacterized protein LOC122529361 [Frieseomelitta varia]
MFVKLILIALIFSFVCVQSIENKAQQLSLLAESNPDTNLDADATEERRALQVSTTSPVIITGSPDNESEYIRIHAKVSNPKKRTTDYKEDRETDLRPGCCG